MSVWDALKHQRKDQQQASALAACLSQTRNVNLCYQSVVGAPFDFERTPIHPTSVKPKGEPPRSGDGAPSSQKEEHSKKGQWGMESKIEAGGQKTQDGAQPKATFNMEAKPPLPEINLGGLKLVPEIGLGVQVEDSLGIGVNVGLFNLAIVDRPHVEGSLAGDVGAKAKIGGDPRFAPYVEGALKFPWELKTPSFRIGSSKGHFSLRPGAELLFAKEPGKVIHRLTLEAALAFAVTQPNGMEIVLQFLNKNELELKKHGLWENFYGFALSFTLPSKPGRRLRRGR